VPLIASIIRYERRIKELEAMVAALEGHHGDVSLAPALATTRASPSERESVVLGTPALATTRASPSERESVVLGDVSPAQHTTAAGTRTVLPSRRLELLPSPEPPSLD
jgi:hypothetical protein